jgi:hypothetical protein
MSVVARVGRSAYRFSRCQTWRLRDVTALTLVMGRPDSLYRNVINPMPHLDLILANKPIEESGCDVAYWHEADQSARSDVVRS